MENPLPKICRLCADIPKVLFEIKKEGETLELAQKIEQYLQVEVCCCQGRLVIKFIVMIDFRSKI